MSDLSWTEKATQQSVLLASQLLDGLGPGQNPLEQRQGLPMHESNHTLMQSLLLRSKPLSIAYAHVTGRHTPGMNIAPHK